MLKMSLIPWKNAFQFALPIWRLQLLQDEGRLLTAGPMPAVDSNDPAQPVSLAPR
jgi:hypothetical protein